MKTIVPKSSIHNKENSIQEFQGGFDKNIQRPTPENPSYFNGMQT